MENDNEKISISRISIRCIFNRNRLFDKQETAQKVEADKDATANAATQVKDAAKEAATKRKRCCK